MSDIKLTLNERLILRNQIEILSKLDPENNPEYLLKILDNGIEGMYWELFSRLSFTTIPKEVVSETYDILDMYRVIGNEINESTLDDIEKIRFNGFDANNDDHYLIMKILIEDLSKYEEHKNTNYNSHSSASIGRYRRILSKYKELNIDYRNVTDEQLQELINCV